MGLFNTIHSTLDCPRCSLSAELQIEVKFGWLNQIDYAVGDSVRWASSPGFPPNDRPPDGCGEFIGYCECPWCQKDFWVKVRVVQDRIEQVSVDASQPGYIE